MTSRFDLSERLDEARHRGLGVEMPVPLHERVDQLCELVYEARHARPSKKKMLAALVLAAPTDADQLEELIRMYDRAEVRDALVAPSPDADVVEFPHRRSGPRPKSSRH